ncbi:MAG: glycine cleavage system aminomethyltransferase GcvT [Candidatus Omnitrophica bacterium]|nr:glycine cleavage system aminomethyltransferase GcvT [Candidatus Omnitrophota bacterium]
MKTTPLLEEHKKLNARLAPFGGWLMPIQYSGIIEEHRWTRSSCGLFDICHMGEFIIEADLAESNLNQLFTFDISSMRPGTCRYGFTLNEAAGIVDDLVVYRIKNNKWMVVVNASTTDNDEVHFKKYLSGKVDLKNVSSGLGKLDLQGPKSADALRKITGAKLERLEYYTFDYFDVLGENIIISRTGYTGELGYELYMPDKKIVQLWQALLSDALVKPVGLGARDTLRLEMGYSLYGQDITGDITPLEAGLDKFVDLKKEFVGKDALLLQKKNGLKKHPVFFIAGSRRSPRHNYRIVVNGNDIGVVTSGSFSPSLEVGIGMGYASQPLAVGERIALEEGNVSIPAVVTRKPFYKNGTARGLKHANT